MKYLVNTRRILRCFEMALGVSINFHKSCVVKSVKKSNGKEDWAAFFKCRKVNLPITYLGMPLGARPSTKALWNSLLLSVGKRLAPWKQKFLSKGGRLVLIKAVLFSIPMYIMLVFKVFTSVAQAIEKLQRGFLLGDGAKKRKLHAVDWWSVCKSKRNGGLWIGRIEDKNKRLLSKWIWRFGRKEESLWKKIICAKYDVQQKSLFWKWNVSSSFSPLVKVVRSLFREGSLTGKILEEGFKVVVGCSDRACF